MKKKKRGNILGFFILLLIFSCSLWTMVAVAADDPFVLFLQSDIKKYTAADAEYADRPYIKKLKNSFTGDVRVLAYGIIQDPVNDSTQNPGNIPVQLSSYVGNMEIQPDFSFNTKYLDLVFKPRAYVRYTAWEEGPRDGDAEWSDEGYVNEWLVRLKAFDRIFASYGRENLQWGPSYLYSPSNPFFFDNGRSNSYLEVPGMDFARLVLVPHMLFTASFIVNTDPGRGSLLSADPFEKTYAVKLDYTGNQNYASLILSQRDEKNTVGYFGGWTLSDALILYSEGSMRKGSDALYPDVKRASLAQSLLEFMVPANSELRPILDRYTSLREFYMRKTREDDSDIYPIVLMGGSYTFDKIGTFALEYLYNAQGYTDNEADLYYSLRGRAASAYLDMGSLPSSFGLYTLYQTGYTGLRFLRKNYAMLQFYKGNIFNRLDTTLRWVQNIDDGSSQVLGLMTYALGNRFDLFSTGALHSGKSDSEFGTFINYQVMFGLRYSL